MVRRKASSLATRMMIHVALVLATALGISMILSIRVQRRTLMEEARLGALWAADGFEGTIRESGRPHDWEEVERIATRATERPRVDRIRLFGRDGDTRLSTDDVGRGESLPMTDAACAGCHESTPTTRLAEERRTRVEPDDRTLRAFAPIPLAPGCVRSECHSGERSILGVVEVTAPLRPIDAIISDSIDSTLLISAIATVIAALAGGLALSRWLQKPVSQLVQGTRRVAEGDLDHRIPCDRTDELGLLCEAFNRMTSRLAETKLLLLRSERLSSLGKLAAGVAHEINNPLTGILSFAEDLHDEIPEGDRRRGDCNVIIRETLRCRKIVRQLLDFSRPEAPGSDRVALNRVVRQCWSLVSRQADFQNVRVEVLLEPELPPIAADPGQIQQVVLNLLVNARDAVGRRGRITISSHSHSDGDRVELVVDDSGPGVPTELREKIFEPFFSTKEDRGSGIGLGVSRSIAEAHGGHLLVADAPDGGARFRLILPAAGPDDPAP